MEHPVAEIASVITTLTTGSPQQQQDTLAEYFLPDASFSHPFCRVPSFHKGAVPLARETNSRWLILCIYRWYRTLSPDIDITVDSAVLDPHTDTLYVSIRQTFAIWFVPLYAARVRLLTVLALRKQRSPSPASRAALSGPGQERARYYISSQEDLYQTNDCAQFLVPRVGPWLCLLWQLFSTALCVVGAVVLLPVYHVLNGSKTAKRVA
ncbi:uncharacterized protein MAM_05194 [Metarhizium album ARSEF 1941]|uniref:SigF-like NTF2-like domain-containing protein n=1 Tax=Metarhizium album (strain ARSEF 1941) TaxID=1081103 RepID=A0A0B2WVZ5_METAS|nr:uncharacterized protein MAM_05194 [Metarhizium album ARSEF 1941]KHN97085.1 hypothetical protein MAM_05194 [Metarhizium album ARSEF 1941]